MKGSKSMVVGGAVLAGLLAAGGGVAYAASGTPTTPPPAQAKQQAHHGKHRSMLGRIEHGELTVRAGKQDKLIDIQRGQVTAVSPTSVTVRSRDGFSGTYTVNAKTKVHKDKAKSTIGAVKTGDRVGVRATKSGSTDTATAIHDRGAKK